MSYFVYILKCSDNSLYCGYTTNVCRRLYEHNNLNKGSKYVLSRRPVKLVHVEEYEELSSALKRENEIKGLKKRAKSSLATKIY